MAALLFDQPLTPQGKIHSVSYRGFNDDGNYTYDYKYVDRETKQPFVQTTGMIAVKKGYYRFEITLGMAV